ncbi:hypothetical protein Taro_011920 [Colocasia esculenta]|uniref:Uncharacterized protein n=1 Tax=Colocasia esculenta TaxID=4460 RepID=A0A843UHK7_COLES|nr:hypothetical protein [Colocasia esculenta]
MGNGSRRATRTAWGLPSYKLSCEVETRGRTELATHRGLPDLAAGGRGGPLRSPRPARSSPLPVTMSRRPVNPSRRFPDTASVPLAGSLHHKSRTSPILSVGLVLVGAFLLIGYSYSGSGGFGGDKEAIKNEALFEPLMEYLEVVRVMLQEVLVEMKKDAAIHCQKLSVVISLSGSREQMSIFLFIGPNRSSGCHYFPPPGQSNRMVLEFSCYKSLSFLTMSFVILSGASCTSEVLRAMPFLQKAYGDSMHKVLHVGPETCSVVSRMLKEEDTEAWGVEPYDLEDADSSCKSLVRKGIVRVADIKFPLPYRPNSFSIVLVSDTLDYLSPRYLNRTLPDLARVSTDGVVIFAGYPGQQRPKLPDLSKFGKPAKLRSSSWWIRYFVQIGLEENETATKKFEQSTSKRSYKPSCQIFHLNSKS